MPRNSVRNAVPASSRCNCTPVPRSVRAELTAAPPYRTQCLKIQANKQASSARGDKCVLGKEASNGRHHQPDLPLDSHPTVRQLPHIVLATELADLASLMS